MPSRKLRAAIGLPEASCVSMYSRRFATASTYVVYLPLDSPIYEELDTLNSLGYLDDYLDEIKPISRIEAARLTIEAQAHIADSSRPDQIARDIVRVDAIGVRHAHRLCAPRIGDRVEALLRLERRGRARG